MNDTAVSHEPMTSVRVMNWILLIMLGGGLADGSLAPGSGFRVLDCLAGLTVGYLCLLWYRGDSDARGFLRPRVLSVAMVFFPLSAVPYYLLRSRRAAERRRALSAYLGFLLLMPVAALVGVFIHIGIRHAYA
jgi:hypothetical protein